MALMGPKPLKFLSSFDQFPDMLSLSLAAAGLLTLVVPCLQLPTARYTYTTEPYGPLRFKSDGSFQLAIFEDLHFGESEWRLMTTERILNRVIRRRMGYVGSSTGSTMSPGWPTSSVG